jgi:hypothetical protein
VITPRFPYCSVRFTYLSDAVGVGISQTANCSNTLMDNSLKRTEKTRKDGGKLPILGGVLIHHVPLALFGLGFALCSLLGQRPVEVWRDAGLGAFFLIEGRFQWAVEIALHQIVEGDFGVHLVAAA